MKAIAGSVKEAGYKPAYSYLIEMKTMHVELNYEWTSLLDRHFKLCMAASRRNVGPRKKAPEVPVDVWTRRPLLPDAPNEDTRR